MAKISQITNQKNKKRVNIFIDDRFFCGLEKETLAKNKLKVDDEVDSQILSKLICESESKIAFEKSVKKLSRRLCSKREIEEFLKRHGFLMDSISICIKKLEEYKFLSDENFADALVKSKKNFGKRAIEFKLKQKGVDQEQIFAALEKRDEKSEFENAFLLAQKYMKSKERTKETKAKLFKYITSHGFDFEITKNCVNFIFKENEEDEGWN